MTEETGFYMDYGEFSKDFLKITEKEIMADIIQAYWKLGWGILRDAINIEPTVPREIGDLRASGDVKVDERTMELLFGFNSVYAHRLHEAPKDWNWSEPGSGPKYLESKLVMFKNKYIKFIADRIGR